MIETGCFGCSQSDWDADGCTCKRFKRFVPNPAADCKYRVAKRMSNADRIRQMTDEELAEWFAPHMMCKICPLRFQIARQGCDEEDCIVGAHVYLTREAKDDAEAKG